MAYEIFNSIEEIKDQIGGAVNQSMEIKAVGPHIAMAAQKHLKLWVGETLWKKLVDYIAAGSTPTNETFDKLMPYVRKPLAFLTFEEYARIGSVQFSDAGLFRTESETHKSAYKYQENNYRESMMENGYEAIEMMLFFLEANEGDYTDWQTSTGYTRNKALVINSAATFRDRYSRSISRHTFEMLRPILEDVEWFSLYPIMGAEQYEDIKSKIADKSITSSQHDAQLLELMQKAAAYFTVKEGIRRNLLQLKGNRVIQIDALEPQSSKKEGQASSNAIRIAHNHNDELGNRYISRIIKYLNDNIDEFPEYKAWKDAQATEVEISAAEDACERFPELYCGCSGICFCSGTSKRKGIIRF